jgi:hypothetical protein
MDIDKNEDNRNRIIKDLFANFCQSCIENICDQALNSIYKLEIVPEQTASCYFMFLHEKILNTQIECKNKIKGCVKKIKYGELSFHLRECNPGDKNKNNNNISESQIINPFRYFDSHSPEMLPYKDLTISSSSSSIINMYNAYQDESKSNKKINKKRKNKNF